MEDKMYKLKKHISTSEAAEVMKIIKWHKKDDQGNILVYESSLKAHPELSDYFEELQNSK